jgi:hypothetical protein
VELVAEKETVVLRHAGEGDLDAVDVLTVECYRPIFESYFAMLGDECYDAVRLEPELTWEQRKTEQNRRLYDEHPDWLWVLEDDGDVFGFVSFWLVPEKSYGHIDNNGVRADRGARAGRRSCTAMSSTTSASRACGSPTSTRASTTRTSRRAGRTRRPASTGRCPRSSTGRTCLAGILGLRSRRCRR